MKSIVLSLYATALALSAVWYAWLRIENTGTLIVWAVVGNFLIMAWVLYLKARVERRIDRGESMSPREIWRASTPLELVEFLACPAILVVAGSQLASNA